MGGLLAIGLGTAAVAVLCGVVRLVNRQTDERFRVIVTSPANEALTSAVERVVVRTVLALDDEMMIELRSAPADAAALPESGLWVHSPANVASIITLTRWRDSQTVVDVRRHSYGVVLSNDQARVRLANPRADLVL